MSEEDNMDIISEKIMNFITTTPALFGRIYNALAKEKKNTFGFYITFLPEQHFKISIRLTDEELNNTEVRNAILKALEK